MDPILDARVAQQRRDRTSVKWQLWGPNVLPLWVAEMDARPCPPVVEAVTAAVARGDTGYPMTGPYAEAFADFAEQAWGWRVDPAATMGSADVMIGVETLIRTVTTARGGVIVSPPCYDSFYGFIASSGRRRRQAPLDPRGRLDLLALEQAFAQATQDGEQAAYLLCNPQNPTGTVHTQPELEALAQLAARFEVTVIADEIHGPLVYPGAVPFTPFLTVPGGERAFAVTSASKAWNLAGFKAALVIAGAEVRPRLATIDDVHTHGVGHVGSIAHIAAFTHGRPWLAQVLTELDARRRLVAELVRTHLPTVRMRQPAATYLAWLDARELGLGDDPAAVWRDRAGVALSSGRAYGADAGSGFARLNFATSEEILREAFDRISAQGAGANAGH